MRNLARLHKFRREFRVLSEINHPNLVGMQTLEVDAGQWFFTMDLVEGEDFLNYVRPDDKLDEGRFCELLLKATSTLTCRSGLRSFLGAFLLLRRKLVTAVTGDYLRQLGQALRLSQGTLDEIDRRLGVALR